MRNGTQQESEEQKLKKFKNLSEDPLMVVNTFQTAVAKWLAEPQAKTIY